MAEKDQDGGLFGWKNWSIPDEWNLVHRDRTPVEPHDGGIGFRGEVPFANDTYNPVRHPNYSIADHLHRYWVPFIKTIFTDMGANVQSAQGGRCQDFELRAMECIEYYGAKQGLTACKDWYDDFIECQTGCKTRLRLRAMHKKRHIDNHLEYLQGKRTWDETYEKPPKYHAFVEPWYDEKYSHMEHAQH